MSDSVAALTVPHFAEPLGDDHWVFRCNHRALYELENQPGGRVSFRWLLANPDGSLSFYYDLLWALSITYRLKCAPEVTFEQWLELLPTGEAWSTLLEKAYRTIYLAFPKVKADDESEAEDDEGKTSPAPSEPEPTGPSSSISQPA